MALEAKPTCSQLGDITSTKKNQNIFVQSKQTNKIRSLSAVI